MTYFILLLIIIIIGVIAYLLFDKDILSPTVISCTMFALCTLFAMYGLNSWNSVKFLSFELILIVCCGLFSFGIGEYILRWKKNNFKIENVSLKIIHFSAWKYILTIIGIIITVVCYITEIKRICNFYGFFSDNLPDLLAFYRTKIGLFSTDLITDGMEINFIIKQMKKVCDVVCVIYMYVFINNIFSKDKIKNLVLYCVPIVLTLFVMLLSSGRSILMHMLVAFMMIFFILYRKKSLNKNISKKIIVMAGISLITVLVLFYWILPIIGRKTSIGFLDYITFYLGTPIPSFQHFLNDIPQHSGYIGNETFSGVYYFLNKINVIDYVKSGSLEWFHSNGYSSNVYTSFRRYFFDFGLFGTIILQFIFGYLFSKLYIYIYQKDNHFMMIVYGYFAYVLIDQIRDEQFYTLITSSTVAYFILLYALYFFFFKFAINSKAGGEIE